MRSTIIHHHNEYLHHPQHFRIPDFSYELFPMTFVFIDNLE